MSEMWMREVEVLVNGHKLTAPLRIDFQIKFDPDPEPNTGEIEIYNLSEETIAEINKGSQVILNAGYSGDVGTIMAGVINHAGAYWDKLDKILKLETGDATDKWASTVVNKSYAPGTKASQIIRDILGMLGLEIGDFQLPNDVIYTKGRTISSAAQLAIRSIAIDCGAKFHINNGLVYITDPEYGNDIAFVLNSDTGLLDTPSKIDSEDSDYKVRCLLNHRITTDSILKIESKTANGFYRVVRGRHICDNNDFINEVEVVAV